MQVAQRCSELLCGSMSLQECQRRTLDLHRQCPCSYWIYEAFHRCRMCACSPYKEHTQACRSCWIQDHRWLLLSHAISAGKFRASASHAAKPLLMYGCPRLPSAEFTGKHLVGTGLRRRPATMMMVTLSLEPNRTWHWGSLIACCHTACTRMALVGGGLQPGH